MALVDRLKAAKPSFKSRRQSRKREALRDRFWPDAAEQVWDRRTARGFTTIPRTLPLVMVLIRNLCTKAEGNPALAYLDLWARNFDEGIISNIDPEEFAFSAGYKSVRGERTWRDHIATLEKLGFIRIIKEGHKDVGHILLLNPHLVVLKLHEAGKVPEEWWNAFVSYATRIGADISEKAPDAAAT